MRNLSGHCGGNDVNTELFKIINTDSKTNVIKEIRYERSFANGTTAPHYPTLGYKKNIFPKPKATSVEMGPVMNFPHSSRSLAQGTVLPSLERKMKNGYKQKLTSRKIAVPEASPKISSLEFHIRMLFGKETTK